MQNIKEVSVIDLQKQLEFKNKQIKNLQNKLDSQDLIINDYYSIKNKYNESKIEISNLKKILENINSNKDSLSNQIKEKELENQNIKNINMQLINEIKDLKMNTNIIFSSQSKLNKELNQYKKQELLLKNIQTENEILN